MLSAKFFTSKIFVGIVVALFIAGGIFTVWRHQKSATQPAAEIKLDTEGANLASNLTPSKFKIVEATPKKKFGKSKSVAIANNQAPQSTIAPANSPAPTPAPEPQHAPEVVQPPANSQPAPAPAQAPAAPPQNPASQPAPAPEPAPAPSNPAAAPARNPAPEPQPVPPPQPASEPTPPPAPPADPARILISEILFNPAGSDAGKEFVELYNAGGTDANLKDWSLFLQNATSSPTPSSLAKFGSKTGDILTIKAHGFLLVGLNGYNQSPAGDVIRSASLPNTSSAIYLKDGAGQQMDAVAYDGATPEGDSVARNNYTGDFTVQTIPTPQNSQSPAN